MLSPHTSQVTPLLGILRGLVRHQGQSRRRSRVLGITHGNCSTPGLDGHGSSSRRAEHGDEEEEHTHKHLVGISLNSSPSAPSSGVVSPLPEARSAPGAAAVAEPEVAAAAAAAAAAARNASARGGLSGCKGYSELHNGGAGAVPAGAQDSSMPQVYLVYSCRNVEELQLLDAELLEEACRCGRCKCKRARAQVCLSSPG